MMKIYTRAGDRGDTGLYGGGRVPKNDPRIEAIGAVDELNALLGVVRMELARSRPNSAEVEALLGQIQHQLFDLGAELATPNPEALGTSLLSQTDVLALESAIDCFEARLEPLKSFILPGGSPASSQAHVARSVCRRAERRLVALSTSENVRGELLQYLNRLGDLLFVLARSINHAQGVHDVKWEGRRRGE